LVGTHPKSASREIFGAARRRGFIQDVLAELSGRSDNLLSFEEVRQTLHLGEPALGSSTQEIPLDSIVGSVGRYRDFNRAFLPRAHVDEDRWTRIEQLQGQASLPPIEVFKVGDVYFVSDGNHRVSVARAKNRKAIKARVVEIPTRVPLRPDTSPDSLILKAGYTHFLEMTSLDLSYPEQHIELTRPGGYQSLLQHIDIHQFYMGLRARRYPTLVEAAEDWYCTVYMPVIVQIRAARILEHFPRRTEADLYLWIAENRARLQMHYGAGDDAEQAVDSFAQEHSAPGLARWIRRQLRRLTPRFTIGEPGPRSRSEPPSHGDTDSTAT
jgi:uncharacterized ParB-like nuclease family protein